MPKFFNDQTEEVIQATGPGSIEFSAVRPGELEELAYTLVGIAVDITGSVMGFEDLLLECLKESVRGCEKAPRSENLLIRASQFSSMVGNEEIHGFRLLADIDVDQVYQPFNCGGGTPLFDATEDHLAAIQTYGEQLFDEEDMDVNAVLFVITDGDDNVSRATPSTIKDRVQSIKKNEKIESVQIVLIGVNIDDARIKQRLAEFKDEAELDEYIDAGDASKGTLAKIAGFVSQSVSSTSQALGSGGPSQLTF